MPSLALATICHDPEGRLIETAQRLLPHLAPLFDGIALQASQTTKKGMLEQIQSLGGVTQRDDEDGYAVLLGKKRRDAVTLALSLETSHVLYVDFDRLLHWFEKYPDELEMTLNTVSQSDVTIIGRTPRAFASHPRNMRETESMVNHIFALTTGHIWDMLAAARAFSRKAAQIIVDESKDDAISNDVSWPLLLLRKEGLSFDYLELNGFEYETADRFANEIEVAGGLEGWLEGLEKDPKRWATRLHYANLMTEAMKPYMR
mgnify:CR=1 FL=1